MVRLVAISVAILFLGTGCATTTTRMFSDVVIDNTAYAATNPIPTVKELAWRVTIPFDRPPESNTKTIKTWLEENAEPPVQGQLKLLFRGDEFFPRLRSVLSNARESIDLQTYLFDNDDVAAEYVKLLRRKAGAIPVRIMFDGVGTWAAGKITAPSQVPDYEKDFDDIFLALTDDGARNLQLRRTPNVLLGSNHMKIIVADGRVAFTGGMNIGREYKVDFRDLMIECRGPIVKRLSSEFQCSWQSAVPFGNSTGRTKPESDYTDRAGMSSLKGNSDVWVLLTEPFKREIFNTQMAAIQRVKKRIFIENPYLWDRQFVDALCQASRRGIDVRVTVPAETNSLVGGGGTIAMANRMIDAGIRVFIIPGYSHVKAAIYDDWVCVGSANYDHLSFSKNRELDFFLQQKEFVDNVAQSVFFETWKRAYEVRNSLDLDLPARISSLASQYF